MDPVDRRNFSATRTTLYADCRVPNDVRKLTEQMFEMTFKPANLMPGTAAFWLDKLKTLGWYRDDEAMFDLRDVLPPFQWAVPQWEALHKAWSVSCRVAFADLTDDQQATLRGADVGAAIDELRLEKLSKLEFTERLRG